MPLKSNKKLIKFYLLLALSGIIFLHSAGFTEAGTGLGLGAGAPGPPPDGTETCRDKIVIDERPKPPAESKGFEVTYPEIRGFIPVAEGEDVLPKYIKYIFYFAIAISGFIVFGALVYSGVRLLTSAGNPSALEEARKGILAGLLGIVLLLGSVLLLNTINPQLTRLTLEELPQVSIEDKIGLSPGVYLLADKDETEELDVGDKIFIIRKHVGPFLGSVSALSRFDFDNKTQFICVNRDIKNNALYSPVLYDKDDYKETCRIFDTPAGYLPVEYSYAIGGNVSGQVSSLKVFSSPVFETKDTVFSSEFAVRFYKHAGLVDDPDDPNDVCTIPAEEKKDEPESIEEACAKWGEWKEDDIGSMEVGNGWILATFEKDDGTGRCEVFEHGVVETMGNTYIGRCKAVIDIGPFKGAWKPCIASIAVYKGFMLGRIY